MNNNTEIRRRADGSIDMDHYAAIARSLHAETTRGVFCAVAAYPRTLLIRLVEHLSRRRTAEEVELCGLLQQRSGVAELESGRR